MSYFAQNLSSENFFFNLIHEPFFDISFHPGKYTPSFVEHILVQINGHL
jgi:hypothetical protein